MGKVLTCGVDEAGRGPLAGPVYAAAVVLPLGRRMHGLRDSKKLSAEARDELQARIKERAVAWAVAHATVEEIDTHNILRASLLAMKRALEQVWAAYPAAHPQPEHVLIDGLHCPPCEDARMRAVVGGDDSVAEISAASILAKTARDAVMLQLHEEYPHYGFDRHKGYPTADHLQALEQHGACPFHRRSFQPVKLVLQRTLFVSA